MAALAALQQAQIVRIRERVLPLLGNDGGIWGQRVPDVDATDGEIIARESNVAVMADIVADDAPAVARPDYEYDLSQLKVANLKTQRLFKGEDLAMIDRIQRGGLIPGDDLAVLSMLGKKVRSALAGVRIARGVVIAGMVSGSFAYDRLGVKLGTLTFGIPTDLKVTPATLWTDAANAKPVADLQNVARIARVNYGSPKNRATFSQSAFDYAVATDEYQKKALGAASLYSVGSLPSSADPTSLVLFSRVLGMQVEINDDQYRLQSNDGAVTTGRYTDDRDVILTNSAFDGDASAWNFGSTVLLESLASSLVDGGAPFPGPTRGPESYVVLANSQLNPPQVSVFGVQRGMARREDLACSAVLRVRS